jgi:hypothetical protein
MTIKFMNQPADLSEHHHQLKVMSFASKYPQINASLFAIPNGGKRNLVTAMKLKAEGVKSGVPDLFLALPNEIHAGLFIELKTPKKGTVSKEQKEWITRLNKNGYRAVVCWGHEEAIEELKKYAGIE